LKGIQLVALSFFKDNNIDYFIEEDNLVFRCFHCDGHRVMELKKTRWCCKNCSTSGTLKALIEEVKASKVNREQIYNPKKERVLIRRRFRHLVNKTPELSQELDELYTKVDRVLAFYIDGDEDKNRSII
jgi:ribosomal protein L37AE/L43A